MIPYYNMMCKIKFQTTFPITIFALNTKSYMKIKKIFLTDALHLQHLTNNTILSILQRFQHLQLTGHLGVIFFNPAPDIHTERSTAIMLIFSL